MVRFIAVDRETEYLLPPSLSEWLPEDHLARFVVEIVDHLDLRELTEQYAGRGSEAHHPATMLSILIYGYATGVFSSRKLERATYDSVAFRYVAANTHPDHATLAAFRRRFLPQLESLFVQVLTVAHEMKVLKLGKISLDGTKLKANASKHTSLSYGHARKLEEQLLSEVRELTARAEAADRAKPESDGMDALAEIGRREARLAAIREAKAKIEARAQERYEQERREYDARQEKRQDQRDEGRKPRGKAPQAPVSGPKDSDQINLTDEESRIMPVSGGAYEQCYNAQACVDATTMLVVSTHVTQATNDKRQVEPALKKLSKLPNELGKPAMLLADTGYFSANNVRACVSNDIEPLVAMKRQPHNMSVFDRFAPDLPVPTTDDPVERMAHRLKTKTGRAAYGLRKQTVEPVFGIIKNILGFRQFMMRGLENVSGEWTLVALAWNMKRLNVLRMA